MSAASTSRTLWTDDASNRFYLVPDAVELPPGPLRLRAGASRHRDVDPATVAPYEVSREEARAFLDARFGAYVADVKGSVRGLVERFRRPTAPPGPPPGEPADPRAPRPGAQLFSNLTGIPAAELDGPEAFARGLRRLAGEDVEAAEEAGAIDQDAERLHRLAGEVDRAGAMAGDRLRSLLERLVEITEELARPPAQDGREGAVGKPVSGGEGGGREEGTQIVKDHP